MIEAFFLSCTRKLYYLCWVSLSNFYSVVVGFSPDTLTANERGEGYAVFAGFLSGRPVRGGPVDFRVQFGTAGKIFPHLVSP
jgi:hypothetical protein